MEEGYHLILICRWDTTLCLEILTSWLDSMHTKNGHIRKEQARSDEAFSNIIPELFNSQKTNIADAQPSFVNSLGFVLSLDPSKLSEYETQMVTGSFKQWEKLFDHYEKTL